MPYGGARPCSTQDTSTRLGKRIKTISTSAFQESFPRDLILNQEKIWVKLKESLIIFCKAMNRDKVFLSLRDMKNIIKMQISMRGTNNSITNMINVHTCTICCAYLVIAGVLLLDSQPVELAGHVICSTSIRVPVCQHHKSTWLH